MLDQTSVSFDRLGQERLQFLYLRGSRHAEEHQSAGLAVLNCFLLDNWKSCWYENWFCFWSWREFSAYTAAIWNRFSLIFSLRRRRTSWYESQQSLSTLFIGLAGVEFLVWDSPSSLIVAPGAAQETVCVGRNLENRAKLHALWRKVGRYNGSLSAPPPT